MSYVHSVLQPDEQVRCQTKIHWMIFVPGVGLLALAVVLYALALQGTSLYGAWVPVVVAAVVAIPGAITLLSAWLRRYTTEIAVTDRRIIYKRGLISRDTIEMEMDKVESVDVTQSIWGRILDYGDIEIHGTGEGIAPLKNIQSPIAFRNQVTGARKAPPTKEQT
jgi:uncharacterized membrane protein YdbT with pleckstrin-like domain